MSIKKFETQESGGYERPKHYGGRIEITREALACLLGFPEDVQINITYDYMTDNYHIVMQSDREIFINNEQMTYAIEKGSMLPVVGLMLPAKVKEAEPKELTLIDFLRAEE